MKASKLIVLVGGILGILAFFLPLVSVERQGAKASVSAYQIIKGLDQVEVAVDQGTARRELDVATSASAKKDIGAMKGIVMAIFAPALLLSLIGGAGGLLLAAATTQALLQRLPVAIPRSSDVGVDWRVVAFTFAASLVTGILFGLAPALHGTRVDVHNALKASSRSVASSQGRLRGLLVVIQMALGLVLLGLAYVVMVVAAARSDAGVQVSPWFLISFYLVYSVGELCFLPAGFSFVGQAAPTRLASLLMGLWLTANFFANLIGGYLAGMLEGFERGEFAWLLGGQADFFLMFVVTCLSAGLLLWALVPSISRLMRSETPGAEP